MDQDTTSGLEKRNIWLCGQQVTNELDRAIVLLRQHARPAKPSGMARFGIVGSQRLGLSVAGMVAGPAKLTSRQMDAWAKGFVSWEVCDPVCGSALVASPRTRCGSSTVLPLTLNAANCFSHLNYRASKLCQAMARLFAASWTSSDVVMRPTDSRTAPAARVASTPIAARTPLTASCSE